MKRRPDGLTLPHRRRIDIREAHVGWYFLVLIAMGLFLYWG